MASIQKFRTALRGFHREDVVRYIEEMNHQHSQQVAQLNNQLRAAREELAQLKAAAEAEKLCSGDATESYTQADELEVYRRAERTEREARQRSAQIYARTNAALSEAVSKVDAATEEMSRQLQSWMDAAESAKVSLQEAGAAMDAIGREE